LAVPAWCQRIAPDPRQGPTIQLARQSLDLTQTELALAVGCTKRWVQYLERGVTYCASGSMATRLERVLGVTIPLPRRLPDLTAQGRHEARDRERVAAQVAAKRARAPALVGTIAPPAEWYSRYRLSS